MLEITEDIHFQQYVNQTAPQKIFKNNTLETDG